MDITPVKFKFKYSNAYFTIVTIALTGLVVVIIAILVSLFQTFTWHRTISAFIFALLLSSMFNDLPKTLLANHDGISIKKFIGSAQFSIPDIISIREPEKDKFRIKFYGAGYVSSENKLRLVSTYLTQKENILILEAKFGLSKLRFAISCPDEQTKGQLLSFARQIKEGKEVSQNKEA